MTLSFVLLCGACGLVSAGEGAELKALADKISAAKSAESAYPALQEASGIYFKNNQYNEFAAFLDSLRGKNKDLQPALDYYTGLARYRQLKYLEEAQDWNEYFDKGDSYRNELDNSLHAVIGDASAPPIFDIYARTVLWQYYKDRDDPLSGAVLSGLMESVLRYSEAAGDPSVLKATADTLLSYKERQKAKQLYAIYVAKLLSSGIKDNQLKAQAFTFYKEGKMELSESLYDAYIERLGAKSAGQLAPELKEIALQFAYKDSGPGDPAYAESIFKQIPDAAFDEGLIYIRAFNLEKMKDFPAARGVYLNLISRYPQGVHFGEAAFKSGVISAYVSADINAAKEIFGKLNREGADLSPYAASSIYQLGLLSQWQGDFAAAKGYYAKIVDNADGRHAQTLELAQKRLQEIDTGEPIEYNLRAFLEAALNKDRGAEIMRNGDLSCHPYRAGLKEQVAIESDILTPQAGCIPVGFSYLWSGHTGEAGLSANKPALNTSYNSAGSKEINLAVVSAAGVIEYCLDFVDVSPSS